MLVKKTNHYYDLDKCLVEWELIQLRVGNRLYNSDEVLGANTYGQRRQTCLQRSNKFVVNPYTDGAGENREKKNRVIKNSSEFTILKGAASISFFTV